MVLKKVDVTKPSYSIDQQGGKGMAGYGIDVCPTIAADSHGTPHAVAYAVKEESKVIGLDGYNQKLTGGQVCVSEQ